MTKGGNPSRRRTPDRRRALELLASCPDGCTEAILLAHGFTVAQMVDLARAGLATAQSEHVVAGRLVLEVAPPADYGRRPASARETQRLKIWFAMRRSGTAAHAEGIQVSTRS
jgi:hypothetical protein